MSQLFSGPKIPKVQAPPPAPTVDEAQVTRQAQDIARRRRGSAANVLTGDQAVPAGSVATKTLLGG
jgi:hypothetical protein